MRCESRRAVGCKNKSLLCGFPSFEVEHPQNRILEVTGSGKPSAAEGVSRRVRHRGRLARRRLRRARSCARLAARCRRLRTADFSARPSSLPISTNSGSQPFPERTNHVACGRPEDEEDQGHDRKGRAREGGEAVEDLVDPADPGHGGHCRLRLRCCSKPSAVGGDVARVVG